MLLLLFSPHELARKPYCICLHGVRNHDRLTSGGMLFIPSFTKLVLTASIKHEIDRQVWELRYNRLWSSSLQTFFYRRAVTRNRINSWERTSYRNHKIYYTRHPYRQLGILKASSHSQWILHVRISLHLSPRVRKNKQQTRSVQWVQNTWELRWP
jgi:hypothetical protein